MSRADGRASDELRRVSIAPGYLSFAEGSALIETGQTRVLCAATVDDGVPFFLRGSGQGWVTAEYAMLPRSTQRRTPRERGTGGRSREIQRLVGRSLRAAADLRRMGEHTITVDCDVLQADGGTRTAAVTGAYVAMYQALLALASDRRMAEPPVKTAVAAISAGIVRSEMLLDLCYAEDATADVDLNVVLTEQGHLVEVQGTAEREPFSRESLHQMLDLAGKGIGALFEAERAAIATL